MHAGLLPVNPGMHAWTDEPHKLCFMPSMRVGLNQVPCAVSCASPDRLLQSTPEACRAVCGGRSSSSSMTHVQTASWHRRCARCDQTQSRLDPDVLVVTRLVWDAGAGVLHTPLHSHPRPKRGKCGAAFSSKGENARESKEADTLLTFPGVASGHACRIAHAACGVCPWLGGVTQHPHIARGVVRGCVVVAVIDVERQGVLDGPVHADPGPCCGVAASRHLQSNIRPESAQRGARQGFRR